MSFAVVKIAGKQFLVRKGDVIETPKIPGKPGEKVSFPSVLLYWDGKAVSVGRPFLEGFAVEGRILEFGRSPKVVVYKYKRRKDSHRKTGHRQDFTRVEIGKITIPGKTAAEEEPSPPAARPKAAGKPKTAAAQPSAGKKTAAGKTAGKKKPAAGKTAGSPKAGSGKKK